MIFLLRSANLLIGYPAFISANYISLNPAMNLRGVQLHWFRTDILRDAAPRRPAGLRRNNLARHPRYHSRFRRLTLRSAPGTSQRDVPTL